MPLVYDCFLFFNEFDLLEIRLNILSDAVDKFILVEADRTFSNNKKPLYFDENKERYKRFLDKIIHVKIDEYPQVKDAWDMEKYQRNQITSGFEQCKLDDVILISDLDEIPNPKVITDYKGGGRHGIYKLKQLHFDYFLNYQRYGKNYYWYRAKISRYTDIINNNYTPQVIRSKMDIMTIKNGGWHFSFLGGVENIKLKIRSFSHQEWNNEKYLDDRLEYKIRMGLDLFDRSNIRLIPILISNKKHPEYIVNNQEKYSHLIYHPINQYIAIKNILYCLPYMLKTAIIQIIKNTLPKSIVKRIEGRKEI
ncbi:MAG: hypothetical protein FWC64_01165 [Treponema sp.]|nr:hypothetical protein [Treponema sp.]